MQGIAVDLTMPISPAQFADYGNEIRRIYADAQEIMLRKIAKRLARGIDSEGWTEAKLSEVWMLNREIKAELAKLNASDQAIKDAITRAYEAGAEDALIELERIQVTADTGLPGVSVERMVKAVMPRVQHAAVDTLVTSTIRAVQGTHLKILRSAEDVYRQTISETSAQVLTGTQTRRQAAQTALNRFADRGVKGFVDTKGRSWELASYTEMAVRTTTAHAAIEGHINTLQANGHDLVIVLGHADTCPICEVWEERVLSVTGQTPGYPTLADATADGLYHPGCIVEGELYTGPKPLYSSVRWYDGEVIVITTASGNELTVTPNHPILTSKGWVAARLLNKGDNIVRYLGHEGMMTDVDPDYVDVPTRIEEVAHSVGESSKMLTRHVPVAAEDFHGDGKGSEVCVIRSNGLLLNDTNAFVFEPRCEDIFGFRSMGFVSLFSKRTLMQLCRRVFYALDFVMGSFCDLLPKFWGHSCQVDSSCFGTGRGCFNTNFLESFANSGLSKAKNACNLGLCQSRVIQTLKSLGINRQTPGVIDVSSGTQFDSSVDESRLQSSIADTDALSYLGETFAGNIAPDAVVKVEVRQYSGHVYNLQTKYGWYACNSIITHNCTHAVSIFIEGVTDIQKSEYDPSVYENRQEQRRLERGIRFWKNREAVALDDAATQQAGVKVKEWQGKMKQFINETGRRRDTGREQIRKAR